MKLTQDLLIGMRLHNLLLLNENALSAGSVVSRLGAVQAQDYIMAQWALGLRLGMRQQDVEAALHSGAILRTHVLRPTWHLLAAADLRWMLQLSAPSILRQIASLFSKASISPLTISRSLDVIARALEGGHHLSRLQLWEALRQQGMTFQSGQMSLLMVCAELHALVCSGLYQGRKPTYALTSERIEPAGTDTISRTEALGMLALRYFRGHGPATIADLCWWSSLNKTDALLGLNQVRDLLHCATLNGQQYWFAEGSEPLSGSATLLLPAFDEFLVGYKDRSATLAPAHYNLVITKNGIFKPVILNQGRVTGTWSSNAVKNGLLVKTRFFKDTPRPDAQALQLAAGDYGRFKGLAADIAIEQA